MREQLEEIPMLYSYKDAEEVRAAYKQKKLELRKAQREMETFRKVGDYL